MLFLLSLILVVAHIRKQEEVNKTTRRVLMGSHRHVSGPTTGPLVIVLSWNSSPCIGRPHLIKPESAGLRRAASLYKGPRQTLLYERDSVFGVGTNILLDWFIYGTSIPAIFFFWVSARLLCWAPCPTQLSSDKTYLRRCERQPALYIVIPQ